MNDVFIIAEAGVNHNGSLNMAYDLVDIAYEAGADAVKFQTFNAKKLVASRKARGIESDYDVLKNLELTHDKFRQIKKYCDHVGITFLSTAGDIESAKFLNELQEMFKVGSAELTDLDYLRELAKFDKPVIMSCGMATDKDICAALDILGRDVVVLHCTSVYPTPFKDANIRNMCRIRNAFGVKVGFSDHTLGIEASIAAVALGATVIEKHFTVDKNLDGPDHKMSLSKDELMCLVKSIRNVELAVNK